MDKDFLIESNFERVTDEKRNNTPIPSDEESELLNNEIDESDIEFSNISIENMKEDNKSLEDTYVRETSKYIHPDFDLIEQVKGTAEIADPEKKSNYAILCNLLSKLICCK